MLPGAGAEVVVGEFCEEKLEGESGGAVETLARSGRFDGLRVSVAAGTSLHPTWVSLTRFAAKLFDSTQIGCSLGTEENNSGGGVKVVA